MVSVHWYWTISPTLTSLLSLTVKLWLVRVVMDAATHFSTMQLGHEMEPGQVLPSWHVTSNTQTLAMKATPVAVVSNLKF